MRILVVEDEESVARIIAQQLAPLCAPGEVPEIALTMEAALAQLEAGQKYDLITLDLKMPGWDRQRTTAKINDMRATNPDGLLIVITGSSDPTVEQEVVAAGAHGFIFKPAVAFRDTFFDNLRALALALIRQPTKYQQNLRIAEALVRKLAGESASKVESPEAN